MAPKRSQSSEADPAAKVPRKAISLATKQAIIKDHNKGLSVKLICGKYSLARTTVNTIIKNKEVLQNTKVTDFSTRLFKGRETIVEMERLLEIWIREKQMRGDSVSQAFICEKAKSIFNELVSESPSSSNARFTEFTASRGWFDRFKKRSGIKSVVRHEETANQEAAEKFKTEFAKLVEEKGYLPQQVFNADETCLFWKKLPGRTFIMNEESKLSCHKFMEDHFSLVCCGNASGDLKIKPMLVYYSENSRIFKENITKALGIYWKSNKKAWVTKQLFNDWMAEVFCPTVENYFKSNKLPLKVLLLLDSAPSHDPELAAHINVKFPFVNIKFIPFNITSLLQPMNQDVIANFKKIYTKLMFVECYKHTLAPNAPSLSEYWTKEYNVLEAIKIVVNAWKDVTTTTMNSAWKKLWPSLIHHFDDIEEQSNPEAEILYFGQAMGLEIDANDVQEFLQEHERELNATDLLEMAKEVESDSGEEEPEEEKITVSTAQLKHFLKCWERVKEIAAFHPNIEETKLNICSFEDSTVDYFKKLLNERTKQVNQNNFHKSLARDSPLTSSQSTITSEIAPAEEILCTPEIF